MAEVEHRLEKSVNQNVLVVAADASDKTNVKALVDQSIDKFNSVDYLILSAGMCVLKLFTDITPADFDSLIDANVRTAFNVLQAVLPQMAAQKFGRVVAIPGILGKAPMIQGAVIVRQSTR